MVFSSAFFMFVFLPIVLLLIGITKQKIHNTILLIASIFFYSWGGVSHTLILFISIIANYVFGILIYNSKGRKAKLFLGIAISINIGLLVYFKYFNFFLDNINSGLLFFGKDLIEYRRVILPIGISFFTFQAMSYVIDVYRKTTPLQRNIFDLALYISLFPQLIAGPIVRYFDIAGQLKKRTLSIDKAASGIQRFIFGLAKKVIIANSMADIADKIFALPVDDISQGVAWLGIIAYTLQIYFDFSGYSDMAIGLGRIFGFSFPENFNYPYISGSIKEFWRRWHISLSSWFRDYLYIPLGGSRKGVIRTYINLTIVFLATGIWHGASWNFVIWGLFHGVFIVIERIGLDKILVKTWKPIQIGYTLLLVIIGWVFFRIESFNEAILFLGKMSSFYDSDIPKMFVAEYLNYKIIFLLIFAILYSFRVFRWIIKIIKSWFLKRKHENLYQIVFQSSKFIISISLFILTVLYLSASTYNPFIYFRF
jgi:alginate O-acetyltransferase complex protein AlgI